MSYTGENGYLLFCDWNRPRISHLFDLKSREGFANSGRFLGQEWNQQTPGQKQWWKKIASRDPRQFHGKMSDYMLFCNVIRDGIQNEEKERTGEFLTVPQLGKRLGMAWHKLPEEQRSFWRKQKEEIFGTN